MVKQAYNPPASPLILHTVVTHFSTSEQWVSAAVILATASPRSGQALPFKFILSDSSCFTPNLALLFRPWLSRWPSTAPPFLSLPPYPSPSRSDRGLATNTAAMSNNDNVMARFLFAILQQKCLKDVSDRRPLGGPLGGPSGEGSRTNCP